MQTKYKLLIATLWIACAIYNYGTVNSEIRWKATHDYVSLHENWRDNSGFLIGFSLASTITGPLVPAFVTNFNQHGFSLTTWEAE